MALPVEKIVSLDEYLSFEENSKTKHELIDGEIIAMTGASRHHVLITGNIFRHIANHLAESHCQVFQSDMKLKTEFDCYYPDVFVSCDKNDLDEQISKQPLIIIEVLSKSTEHIDRGIKLDSYLQLSNLQEYVLVHQDKMHLMIFKRVKQNWQLSLLEKNNILELDSINIRVPVTDLYTKVSI